MSEFPEADLKEYSLAELKAIEAEADKQIAPGRSCGSCSMCCKIARIDYFQKPPGQWCPHCNIGKGCGMYETRPKVCRTFFCHWMQNPNLGPEWKPDKAKMYLCVELSGQRLAAHVDPASPGAWRKEPYYSDLKRWAVQAAKNETQVSVFIDRHAIVILPDRDIDLGIVGRDEMIVSTKEKQGDRFVLGAEKIKRDDYERKQKEWAAARQRVEMEKIQKPGSDWNPS